MKTIEWYFDYISPFAYLQFKQFQKLPSDIEIEFKPVLLIALLNHWGTKGPAEIEEKRRFTYRHVQWLAQQAQIPFKFPPAHPFNPLNLLRLTIADGNQLKTIQTIFDFVWKEGLFEDHPNTWKTLSEKLEMPNWQDLVQNPQVKQQLRTNGEQAIEKGIFGVPTFYVDQAAAVRRYGDPAAGDPAAGDPVAGDAEIFWGVDSTEMFLEYLQSPDLFKQGEMARISHLPVGASRF